MQQKGETYKEYLVRVVTDEIGNVVKEKMEQTRKELLSMNYNVTLEQTEEILKNYKKLKEHIKNSKMDEKQIFHELKEYHNKNIESMMSEIFSVEELETDGILKNRYKTIMFLNYIDNVLNVYLEKEAKDKVGIRKKNILKNLYMEGRKQSEFIYDNYEVERTFYTDKEKLIKDLAPLFFGIRGLNI